MTQLPLKRIPLRLPRLVAQRKISPEEISKRQAELKLFKQRCYQIFERVRPELIADYYNWPILIEPESGDYFIDEDELVAYQKAREKHPQGRFLFFRLNETGVSGRI